MGSVYKEDCPFCAGNARKRRESATEMGADDPKLILPLKRAADGRLGVTAGDLPWAASASGE